jgi:hypothetical protein
MAGFLASLEKKGIGWKKLQKESKRSENFLNQSRQESFLIE